MARFQDLVRIIVSGRIPWLFCPLQLQSVLADYVFLNRVATSLIDWMSDISVQLVRCIVVAVTMTPILGTTIVAILAANVILASTTMTALC